jgi:hypothetical protein
MIDDRANAVRERYRCARACDIRTEPCDERITARCKELGCLFDSGVECSGLACDPRLLHFPGFPVEHRQSAG